MRIPSVLLAASAGVALAAFAIPVAKAAEPKPTLIGDFKDWHVYSVGRGANRLCYALSEPRETKPDNVKRDKVSFLISSWPGRKVRNEPSVVPGYAYKDGSKATVEVGSTKFSFFTQNQGTDGGAWVETPADEGKLLAAMKRGAEMSVTGTSTRGTLTRDNYSLAGLSAALDKIAAECK
jgi:invasion protein IalB